MGAGAWSASTYQATTSAKINTGRTFSYTNTMRGSSVKKAAPSLDPRKTATAGPCAGQVVREARDSDEHPNSVPIAVFFDETGSMGRVPRVVQQKLGGLFSLLVDKKYVTDPQVLIGAYGDAETDDVPLQIGQFESDNRVDDTLDNIYLEGYGGGNGGESQALVWYYMANHTVTDAWEKRNKKGYLFLIGDEVSLTPHPSQLVRLLGIEEPKGSLKLEDLAQAVQEKWEVFILLIDNNSARWQHSHEFYARLFGDDHVVVVENQDTIAETIGMAVGYMEGAVDADDAADDLRSTGSSELVISTVQKSLNGLSKIANAPKADVRGTLALAGNKTSNKGRL